MFQSMTIPIVQTERLRLREWRESDLEWLNEIYSDEDLARYIGGARPNWQVWRYLATIIGHWQMRGYGMWVAEEMDTGDVAGYVGHWAPADWPEQEVGYTFRRKHHGKGYATEAATACLRYAYKTLGWKTAISLIDDRNKASQKVAARLGASYEGKSVLFDEHPAQVWRHLSPSQLEDSLQ